MRLRRRHLWNSDQLWALPATADLRSWRKAGQVRLDHCAKVMLRRAQRNNTVKRRFFGMAITFSLLLSAAAILPLACGPNSEIQVGGSGGSGASLTSGRGGTNGAGGVILNLI